MPLNTSIISKFAELPERRARLDQAAQQGQINNITLKTLTLQQQQKEADAARDAQVKQVIMQHHGDPARMVDELYKVDPTTAQKVEEVLKANQQQERTTRINEAVLTRHAADENFAAMQGQPAPEQQVGQPGTVMPQASIPEGGTVAPIPSPIPAGFRQEQPMDSVMRPGIPDLGIPSVSRRPQSEQELYRKTQAGKADTLRQALLLKQGELELTQASKADIKLDESYRGGHKFLRMQRPNGSQYEVDGGAAEAAPRAQVPGTDIPLSGPVQNQRIEVAQASAAPLTIDTVGTDGKPVTRVITRRNATGNDFIKPPSAASTKGSTASEKKMYGFYERVANAKESIDSMQGDIAKMSLAEQTQLTYAPNVLQSAVGKRYTQAKNDFINATLRRESGAAISNSEYERFDQIYFPRPGDDGPTLAQKKKARDVQLNTLKRESGKAWAENYGEENVAAAPPAQPGAIENPYRKKK